MSCYRPHPHAGHQAFLLASVWLRCAEGEALQRSAFLCRFDGEAQLPPVTLTHSRQCHAGTFTASSLTFDASSVIPQHLMSETHLLDPINQDIDVIFNTFSYVFFLRTLQRNTWIFFPPLREKILWILRLATSLQSW